MTQCALIVGDNRQRLRDLPDDSIGAVVCDPPYGLGKELDMVEVLQHWLAGDDFTASGGGFMGKTWDGFVPGPATWREVYRVLKPCGHVVAFSGTRTYDMATLAIRLAGFEIRDTLMWLYGQGFPKSMDLSKAFDKTAGAEREVVGVDHERAGRLVNQMGEYETASGWSAGNRSADITAPSTDEAKRWEGWGTALKPAWEPILLARKPFRGRLTKNVLMHGVGALNIDATRIDYRSDDDKASATPQGATTAKVGALAGGIQNNNERTEFERSKLVGRWPANVMLSHAEECTDDDCHLDCPVAQLDEQTGVLTSGDAVVGQGRDELIQSNTYGGGRSSKVATVYADSGGASRFFYNGKVSKSERNAGLPEGMVNPHPTVKPVAVMEWLIKLVAPEGEWVIDPFLGSGSTAVAAVNLGYDFIGMDLDPHYVEIASHRARHAGVEPRVIEVQEAEAS